MNMKHKFLVALVGLGAIPIATALPLKDYKIAVIGGSEGASEIVSGYYDIDGLSESSNSSRVEVAFASNMNMCVALMKSKQLEASEEACNKAVSYSRKAARYFNDSDEVRALAYSNRGVVRKLLNNNTGAFEDFKKALQIDKNTITDNNFNKLIVSLNRPFDTAQLQDDME